MPSDCWPVPLATCGMVVAICETAAEAWLEAAASCAEYIEEPSSQIRGVPAAAGVALSE